MLLDSFRHLLDDFKPYQWCAIAAENSLIELIELMALRQETGRFHQMFWR